MASAGVYGSYTTTFTSKPESFFATSRPMWPKPTSPTVLPCSSGTTSLLVNVFLHSPFLIAKWALAIFLHSASIIPTAKSETAWALRPCTLNTRIPRLVASSTLTFSSPALETPTILSFGMASITLLDTGTNSPMSAWASCPSFRMVSSTVSISGPLFSTSRRLYWSWPQSFSQSFTTRSLPYLAMCFSQAL